MVIYWSPSNSSVERQRTCVSHSPSFSLLSSCVPAATRKGWVVDFSMSLAYSRIGSTSQGAERQGMRCLT
jgi:hypothetical protein